MDIRFTIASPHPGPRGEGMKATILKEDVEKALEAIKLNHASICETCVLMQISKRLQISIEFFSWDGVRFKTGEYRKISPELCWITQALEKDWASFIGKEIELPDL